MAVKKAMKSPTLFCPEMISPPPKISTPQMPMPDITSISPGMADWPRLEATVVRTRSLVSDL